MACASSPINTRGKSDIAPGASTARGAVVKFFDAVHEADLQAMGMAWGTTQGASRETIPTNELEKREIVMQCYFAHDTYTIGEETPGQGGQRTFRVSLRRKDLVRTTTVTTIQGPKSRWFVETLDIAAVRDMCTAAPKVD